MGNKALTLYDKNLDIQTLGSVLAKSGYFDTQSVAQAIVRVLAGAELGIEPVQSMVGIHIINGKPVVGAIVQAALVRRSGRYDYKVRKITDDVCEVEFFSLSGNTPTSLGVSTYSISDAKRSGSKAVEKFPRNILFAGAIRNGVRWFCPDVTVCPVYTADELGAADVIDIETGALIAQPPEQPAVQEEPAEEEPKPAKAATREPLPPDKLRAAFSKKLRKARDEQGDMIAPVAHREEVMASIAGFWPDAPDAEDRACRLLGALVGTSEVALLDVAQVKVLKDWLASGTDVCRVEADNVLAIGKIVTEEDGEVLY